MENGKKTYFRNICLAHKVSKVFTKFNIDKKVLLFTAHQNYRKIAYFDFLAVIGFIYHLNISFNSLLTVYILTKYIFIVLFLQGNITDIEEDNTALSNETSNEAPSSNDLFNVFDPINDPIIESNTSVISNNTDYDYLEERNNYFDNDTNSTTISQEKSIFNSIYRLFFNNGNNSERTFAMNETITLNYTSSNGYEEELIPDNSTHYPIKHKDHLHHHKHHHSVHNRKEDIKQKKPSDRCLEADYQVCKSWSKRRLLHAQKCCSGVITREEKVSCTHFRKKRCKKIQSILKCCIKTLYVEPSISTTTNEPCNETSTEESLNTTTQSSTDRNQIQHIICCKPNGGSRTCRVSTSGTCEVDEHVESEHSLKESK